MTAQPICVFPDTNLFLHYRAINEIDWPTLVKARPIQIKIAPMVTRELDDKIVVHQVRKIRDRATSSIKLLRNYISENLVRDGVTLQFLTDDPTAEYAAAHNLNLLLADDRLIGSFLLYRDANPDARCILVTNDLLLTVKLTQRKIDYMSLDDSLLLPSQPDPLEKKNKQLEAELLRYKSREPDLSIKFLDGQSYARFRLSRPANSPDPEPEIQARLAAAKEKCKPVELAAPPEPSDPNNPFAGIAEQIRQITADFHVAGRNFYEDYNRRVEKYYRDYEKYLRGDAKFKTLPTRTIKLDLILSNSGTCPAEDIDVLLYFPDGFELYGERRPPKPPEEPEVPSKEMNLFPHLSMPTLPYIPNAPRMPDRTLPRIRKTSSYDVDFEVPKLKHGFMWTIEPFLVVFDSWASAASFTIDYTLHAGNMIDEQPGQVAVIIEKVS